MVVSDKHVFPHFLGKCYIYRKKLLDEKIFKTTFSIKKVKLIFVTRRPLPFKKDLAPKNSFLLFSWKIQLFFWKKFVILHLHICARASPLAQTFVCLCLIANELSSHAYKHSHVCTHNANHHSSPLTYVQKTTSRASATNGEANDAMNDEVNMRFVRSSFALLFTSALARMCKCGIK